MGFLRLGSRLARQKNYLFYSQKSWLSSDNKKESDLIFKNKNEIQDVSKKPVRIPSNEEEKEVWPALKESVKNFSNFNFLFVF